MKNLDALCIGDILGSISDLCAEGLKGFAKSGRGALRLTAVMAATAVMATGCVSNSSYTPGDVLPYGYGAVAPVLSRVEIKVVDQSGAPIGGASVTVMSEASARIMGALKVAASAAAQTVSSQTVQAAASTGDAVPVTRQTSATTGYVYFELASGTYAILIEKTGYKAMTETTTLAGGTVKSNLVLVPYDPAVAATLGSASGKLTDPSGVPLTGALVILTASGGTNYTAITSQDGSWGISNAPAGVYDLTYVYPGTGDPGTTPVTVSAGTTTSAGTVQLAPVQMAGIYAVLADPSGTPLAGVDVQLVRERDLAPVPGVVALTGMDGSFTLKGVAAGGYYLQVASSGAADAQPTRLGPYTVGATNLELGSLSVSLLSTLEVSVKDSDTAAPLAEARVMVLPAGTFAQIRPRKIVAGLSGASAPGQVADTGVTSNGMATFKVLPGKYDIIVDRPLYRQGVIEGYEVVAGAAPSPVTVSLDAYTGDGVVSMGSVEGFVTNSFGSAAKGVTVTLENSWGSYFAVTDGSGKWKTSNVLALASTVRIFVLGYAEMKTQVQVTAGVLTKAPTLTMVPSGSFMVSGRVLGPGGTPLGGIGIYLVRALGREPIVGAETVSGTDGRWAFRGAVPGEYFAYIAMGDPSFYPVRTNIIKVDSAGVDTGDMTLDQR